MTKLKYDPTLEHVYNLSFIKQDVELVVHGKEKYIMTPDAYFPINSDKAFIENNDKFILKNEDNDVFILSKEHFETIKNLL